MRSIPSTLSFYLCPIIYVRWDNWEDGSKNEGSFIYFFYKTLAYRLNFAFCSGKSKRIWHTFGLFSLLTPLALIGCFCSRAFTVIFRYRVLLF